ncbi:MAG TPA: GAF domain-containing protein, partial [Bacillaceae bacterium]
MRREQTRYSRLADITKIINTKLELREVLQHVTVAISEEIVLCSAVGIYLPQEDGTFRGFAGKTDFMDGVIIENEIIDPKHDLFAREVIEKNKTIYIPDVSKDHRPDPKSVKAFKIKSLLGLPISTEQEFFGLVFLFDYGTPMNLTKSEIQSVEAYVNMAAVAIQNANNLTQKENLIAEKQLLLDVTRELSKCSSIQETLDTCFFYLEKMLESPHITVRLLDPKDKNTARTMKASKESDWTEADWLKAHKSIEGKIKEAVKFKQVVHIPAGSSDGRSASHSDGMDHLLIPFVSMGEVLGVIAVSKAGSFSKSHIQVA